MSGAGGPPTDNTSRRTWRPGGIGNEVDAAKRWVRALPSDSEASGPASVSVSSDAAMEAIGRNPEAAGEIRTVMILACGAGRGGRDLRLRHRDHYCFRRVTKVMGSEGDRELG